MKYGLLAQFVFSVIHKIISIKRLLKFQGLFLKHSECSEIITFVFLLKKWTVFLPKFYAEYEYSDHTQNFSIGFEHIFSLDLDLHC